MTQLTYARVENGQITEFPLTPQEVAVSGHRREQYYQCVYDDPPEVPEFHMTTETLRLTNDCVRVGYVIESMPLSYLIHLLLQKNESSDQIAIEAQKQLKKRIENHLQYAVSKGSLLELLERVGSSRDSLPDRYKELQFLLQKLAWPVYAFKGEARRIM